MAQRTTTREAKTHRNSDMRGSHQMEPSKDLIEYMKDYAREKPEMAALCCFGLGFVLGWKLKLW